MRSNDSNKQGAMALEFAILMSLLLIPLFSGMWDASQLIDINQILTRAAREGVVMASRGDDPVEQVQAFIESAGLESNKLVVNVELGQEDPELGQEVAVKLNYSLSGSTMLPWDELLPSGISIAAYAKVE
ncbi:TadE family protein [uncultured Pseudodesulfovibrio sp.]|uniref:TadE/TadG family type IV pilus assembly protein n=1 Tax=uncultured Pseudodesulfovibrio sp. TaxID=2035858 RepID=UPI0029C6FBF9|nr:TadE family protein [uncultured Pseudodesulfovibrio sp.]